MDSLFKTINIETNKDKNKLCSCVHFTLWSIYIDSCEWKVDSECDLLWEHLWYVWRLFIVQWREADWWKTIGGGEDGNTQEEENSSSLSQERPGSDVSVTPVNWLRNKLDSSSWYLTEVGVSRSIRRFELNLQNFFFFLKIRWLYTPEICLWTDPWTYNWDADFKRTSWLYSVLACNGTVELSFCWSHLI